MKIFSRNSIIIEKIPCFILNFNIIKLIDIKSHKIKENNIKKILISLLKMKALLLELFRYKYIFVSSVTQTGSTIGTTSNGFTV